MEFDNFGKGCSQQGRHQLAFTWGWDEKAREFGWEIIHTKQIGIIASLFLIL